MQEHRKAAYTAITRMKHHAKDMIYWPGDERSPERLSLDELQQADLVLLIVAHRYGTIPQSETRSITEIEFDTARETGKPIVVFFVDPNSPWPGNAFDWEQYPKLVEFKKKIQKYYVPNFFTIPDSLFGRVTEAIESFDRNPRWAPPPEWMPLLAYSTQRLDETADAVIEIGLAEDQLPLALEVSRSDSLEQPLAEVTSAFRRIEAAGVPAPLELFLQEGIRSAREKWKTRGKYTVELDSGATPSFFVTKKIVAALFSQTLLSQLLPYKVFGSNPITTPLLLRNSGSLSSSSLSERATLRTSEFVVNSWT